MNFLTLLKQRSQYGKIKHRTPTSGDIITLTHRRIFILPSKRGFGFLVLIALLLLLAYIKNNNLTYALAFLLTGVFVVSIAHNYCTLAGLIVKKGKISNAFAGDQAGFEIIIENQGAKQRNNLHLSAVNATLQTIDIAPQETIKLTLYSHAAKRGWLRLHGLRLYAEYPLGLFRGWTSVNFDYRALVYPKPAPESLHRWENPDSRGGKISFDMQGNEDFYALKKYESGDSIRHIHWKSYAKGYGLFVKQYTTDYADETWLDYTQTPGNNTEQRLSQLCRGVLDAKSSGNAYGFHIPGILLPPAKDLLHFNHCMQALALFKL